jgi:RNA polymerase sigma-70 factor (ECF subfamily)
MGAVTDDELPDGADEALARAVVAGEPWAQRKVWDLYGPMVNGVLRRALGPGHDFDDLLQDVFLRVFHRVIGLRDLGALRSFIYSITIRVVRWEIRRAQSRRRRHEALLNGDGDGPEVVSSNPEARDLLERVQLVLDKMPQKVRAVFVLRYVEGQELGEIAEGLEISLSTTKRWLKRGVRLVEAGIESDPRLNRLLRPKGSPIR